ncbi:MAG: hypothetical protein NTY53_27150 [Kiritimatiellaeota bacterium]|nr:hypothetical protein [Kiritimatiellota bacterium]
MLFTRDVLNPKNLALGWALDRLKEPGRRHAMVFVDAGLAHACPELPGRVEKYFLHYRRRLVLAAPPRLVPGGEAAKNSFAHALRIVRDLLALHLDRHASVVIIGGGAVLDLVGFAASLVHRGLRVVRLPTTVLAQCDSGVGVKTAVNFGTAKNLVGTFAPPFAVINDFDLLDSLPDRDWRGGIAEAFKVALIKDAKFFRWLCRNAPVLRQREPQMMAQLVTRCAELHLHHIGSSGDPFELGRAMARPLRPVSRSMPPTPSASAICPRRLSVRSCAACCRPACRSGIPNSRGARAPASWRFSRAWRISANTSVANSP